LAKTAGKSLHLTWLALRISSPFPARRPAAGPARTCPVFAFYQTIWALDDHGTSLTIAITSK